MIEIVEASYIREYRIHLLFNNKVSGEVDLKDALWGPIFEPLKNPAFFKAFKVSEELGTIVWENGADFAPEFLYDLVSSKQKNAV